mgnify:CR=1 FL=1
MKSVLISTRPKWCEKICRKIGEENGIPVYLKPVEVRKSAPKEVPFKAYLYCTKPKVFGELIMCKSRENATLFGYGNIIGINRGFRKPEDELLFGKVIGEFVCDRVEKYEADERGWYVYPRDDTCLWVHEIASYGKGKPLYGWHISDLKIYDKPRELGEFKTPDKPYHEIIERDGSLMFMDGYESGKPLKRAPQSWQYVEEF